MIYFDSDYQMYDMTLMIMIRVITETVVRTKLYSVSPRFNSVETLRNENVLMRTLRQTKVHRSER